MNILEYPDREFLAIKVADVLASQLKKHLYTNERVSLAVPGGSTPGPVFDILRSIELDWSRVHVMLTDERWVQEDHELSNTALLKSRFLKGKASEATFVPFFRADMTATDGAAQIAPTLAPMLPLCVLMLGMGADMHTASLFPGAEGIDRAFARDAPSLCPIKVADQDIQRVTLPAHVLQSALSTHLVIFGAEKRAALERAIGLPPEEAPIAAVLDGGTVHWAA